MKNRLIPFGVSAKLLLITLCLLTMGVGEIWGDDVYIYYMNVHDWEGVKCHNWGVSGTEWCNAEANMSSAVMTKNNHTYYKIKLKDPGNTRCKFYNYTCDGTDATGDLTIDGNCYQGGIWINMLPITGGTIFYDNSSTNWVPTGSDKVQFFVGDGGYTSVYDMTKIDNTKLYYKNMSSYGGATYLRFAKANYESNGFNADNVPTTSTDIYTGTYEFNSNSLYLFTTTNNDEHPDITTKYIGSDGSLSELNFTITLKAKVKAFGSASYVEGVTKGNLNASSYKFSEYNTCGTSTGESPVVASGSTSGNFDAGYTAETSLSVTSITPGYTFRGWYDSDGNKLSDDTEYTAYLPKKTTDVYAYFEEDSWSVAFSNDGNGTVTEPNSTPRTVGQITGIDINASAAFGYQFSTWTSSTGGSFDAAGTANTKFYPTAATTVTANFARRYAYIEANFQVYDATRSSRTPVGNVSWKDDSRAIEMAYDGTNRRYYLHTYSTPAQLAERLNDADAYFYIKTTSSSSSTFTDVVSYYADGSSNQSLSAVGSANKKAVTTSSSANSFKFTGSEDGYVILYFDGENVWYELECKVTYDGNDKTGGTTPTDATYYAKGATVTVAAEPASWAKTGYTFGGWNKANDGSGTNYTAGTGTFSINENTTLYAKWSQTVTLHDNNGGSGNGSVDVIYNATSTSSLDVAEKTGYRVEAYYAEEGCTNKVLTDDGRLVGYTGYVEDGKWVHSGATTLYTNWTAKTYTIPLEGMEADEEGTTSVNVTFDASTNMTASDAIETPTKAHYDFGGYWTSDDRGSTLDNKVIDEDGKWIKDVTGYTSHDGSGNPTWVHDYAISLYAKWTETAYTITPSVSPAGAGSVNTVTDAHLITPSSTITATPANAAWIFDYWELGTNVGENSSDGNTITVTSDMNSTITAHFKPRYELVGDIWDGSGNGGMPGWSYDGTGVFTFNSFTALGTGEGKGCDLSCSRTLTANTTYRFQIHDRKTGNHGYVTAATYIGDGDHLLFNTKDQNVMLAATGAGRYTFRITNITEGVGDYYPTVTVERPHQVYFGTGYAGIDNLSSVTSGTTGGTLAVTTSAGSLSNEDWVTYGTDVTYTPSAATGYTFEGFYTSNTYSSRFTQDNPWVHYNVTSDDNVYAKFEEKSTSVTLANDGNGHVTIGGNTETSTTCGVTTSRELTAIADDGYMFSSWSKEGTDITLTSTSTNPTTLSGNGAGATSDQTVTANFTERWVLKAESLGWGSETFTISNIDDASGDVVGYVDISLAANKNYEFTMKDLETNDIYKNSNAAVQYMTYSNHTDWGFATDMTYNCGITTAGRGTYRFTWNITDKTMTVTYPTSYVVNLGVKSISAEGSEGTLGTVVATDASSNTYANGSYIASGETVTVTATAPSTYTFVGWWNSSAFTGGYFASANPTSWTVDGTVNAYAKFTEDTNTFSATSGNNWSTTANWSAGHVPTLDEVAIINAPVTVDITNAKAKRVLLMQNSTNTGKIEIPAGQELIIKETIKKTTDGSSYGATDENDIVIGSDASNGLGALVMGTHNGTNKATVNFYSLSGGKKGSSASVNQFVGTPFNDENDILYNWYNSWVYGIEYTSNVIGVKRINSGEGMDPFKGYIVISADGSGHTYWQQGTLNATTDQTISGLNWQSGVGTANMNNENLLANSWTAPIRIGALQSSDFINAEASIYIFNSCSESSYTSFESNYDTYTINTADGTDVIPSMQSFSVFTTGSDASLTLNYEKLVYTPAVNGTAPIIANKAPRRNAIADTANKIRLFVRSDSGYGDMLYMWEHADFDEGFENGWDGHKLFGEAVAPQLYAVTPDGKMTVNCVPTFEGVVMGFQAGTKDDVYTFTFECDDEAQALYLYDTYENEYTRVESTGSYTFTTTDNAAHNRFVLTRNAPQVATGVETTHSQKPAANVRKVLIHDHIYILRSGKMYSVDGALVK